MMIVCKPSAREVTALILASLAIPLFQYVFWDCGMPVTFLVITCLVTVLYVLYAIAAFGKICTYSETGIAVKILCISYNVSWADIVVIKKEPRFKIHGARSTEYGDVVIFSTKALPRVSTRLDDMQLERPFSLFFVTFTPEKNLIAKETQYSYICKEGYDEFPFPKKPAYHVDKEQFLNALSAWGIDIPME